MSGQAAIVFGLSEAASAVAHQLHGAGWRVVLAADAPPKVHRRRMAFADVWWDGTALLEGLRCTTVSSDEVVRGAWPRDGIAHLALAPEAVLDLRQWAVAVDARLTKRGTPLALRGRADVTIGCGPGHVAGMTCDLAIETQWGDRLGAVITEGPTAPLAGEPRRIDGVGRERIVYAPLAGDVTVLRDIGDPVAGGDIIARIGVYPVAAPIAGTLRGMLRDGIAVVTGDKLCEVDPRSADLAVFTGIGQRPAAIAQGVAQALGTKRHRPLDTDAPGAVVPGASTIDSV